MGGGDGGLVSPPLHRDGAIGVGVDLGAQELADPAGGHGLGYTALDALGVLAGSAVQASADAGQGGLGPLEQAAAAGSAASASSDPYI